MSEFVFDCTLTATIRVQADTLEDARAMLNYNLDCASCNAGAWDKGPLAGEPILFEASLQEAELFEKDGEEVCES